MPALLRALIVAVATTGLLASTVVLALTGDPEDLSLLVQTIALVALWSAPLFAGVLRSAWSTSDQDAQRRVRRVIVVSALVTLAGAVLFVVSAAGSGSALWAVVLVAVLGTASFPVSLRLGTAARVLEERRSPPDRAADEEAAAVDADLRLARRRSLVGGAIGAAVGLGALVLIAGLSDDAGGTSPALLAFVLAFALLGVVCGRIGVQLRLAARTRDLLGSDYGAARRVGRIVRGRTTPDSAEEEDRAARYARLAARAAPFQIWTSLLTTGAVVILQVPSVLADGVDPVRGSMVVVFAVLLVVVVPVQGVQRRRLRAYAAAHPPRASA